MLYEEDFEDDHIDFPEPYDPDATVTEFQPKRASTFLEGRYR